MIKWLCLALFNTDFPHYWWWCHFVTRSLYLHTHILSPTVQLFSPLLLMICLLRNECCFCLDIQHVLESLLQADSGREVVCRDYVEISLKCTKKIWTYQHCSRVIVFLNFTRYLRRRTPRSSLPNDVRKELQILVKDSSTDFWSELVFSHSKGK